MVDGIMNHGVIALQCGKEKMKMTDVIIQSKNLKKVRNEYTDKTCIPSFSVTQQSAKFVMTIWMALFQSYFLTTTL